MLGNDITLGNDEWTPIGTQTAPFVGTFHGNGHVISGLNTDSGLFGMLGNSSPYKGTVVNLGVSGGYLFDNNTGLVLNCYSKTGAISSIIEPVYAKSTFIASDTSTADERNADIKSFSNAPLTSDEVALIGHYRWMPPTTEGGVPTLALFHDGTGDGTAVADNSNNKGPYILTNEAQLRAFASMVNNSIPFTDQHIKLVIEGGKLDLSKTAWTPIGTFSSPFLSNFDGSNTIITLGEVGNDNTSHVGFFGQAEDATIKNLGIEGEITVDGNVNQVGALIGEANNTTITASYDGETIDAPAFTGYVSSTIGVSSKDAAKITTAVVVESGGNVRHIPTFVGSKGGKYFARINSLTANSCYVLIYNEVEFDDADGKWYEDFVSEMGSRLIINGVGEGLFDGDHSITRAEFAAITVRALGLPSYSEVSFSDVSEKAWYANAVGTAASYGLVNGRGDGTFDPDARITREEAMILISNAAEIANFTGESGNLNEFTDAAEVSDWSKTAAQFCVGSELVNGSDGKLNPRDNISRAETATIVLRLLQRSDLVDTRAS